MKSILTITGIMLLLQTSVFAQNYKPSWMSNVKSWQVTIELEYLDSSNATNFTRINYRGSGIITNEIMPEGSRMTWPQTASTNPESFLQIPVKGSYMKKYAEEPGPMQVEAWTCSGKIDEKVLVSLGATFDGKCVFSKPYLPVSSSITCSGKNPPQITILKDLPSPAVDPADENAVFVKDCGTDRHTLSDTVQYTTSEGGKVKVKYSYFPME